MADIVDLLLMGEPEPFEFDGERISLAIVKTMETLRTYRTSFSNQISWGYAYKYRMYEGARKILKFYSTIENQVYELYLKRFKEKKELGINMIDFIVEENRKRSPADQWSKFEIIGNINVFQVAGAGTSLNAGTTMVDHFSKDVPLQKRVRGILDRIARGAPGGKLTAEAIMEDAEYDLFLKELFRKFGSSAFSAPRVFAKNCKIGGYKFRKGDLMLYPLALRHECDELFANPEKFDMERFTEENAKKIKDKTDYNPFSIGIRNCIGQYLANLFQACIMAGLISEFEIDVDGSVEHVTRLGVGYGINNCTVKMRPISR